MDKEELNRRAKVITDDCMGVLPTYEAFYIISIKYSAERCLEAFDLYEKNKFSKNADLMISLLQVAVGHAAALARYFWPSPKGKRLSPVFQMKKARAEKLRKAFLLSESSILANKELRNAWEHFDEKLDEYLLQVDFGYFFPTSMIKDITILKKEGGHFFKVLDVEKQLMGLMGDVYFFGKIKNEVELVYQKANYMDQSGGRLKGDVTSED